MVGAKVTLLKLSTVKIPSGTVRVLSSAGVLGSRSTVAGLTVLPLEAVSLPAIGKVTVVLNGVLALSPTATGGAAR